MNKSRYFAIPTQNNSHARKKNHHRLSSMMVFSSSYSVSVFSSLRVSRFLCGFFFWSRINELRGQFYRVFAIAKLAGRIFASQNAPRKVGLQKTKALARSAFVFWSGLRGSNPPPPPWQGGALPNELNPHIWCLRSESNQRHRDFQSLALPTELQRHTGMATRMGLEPTTSSVTG